MGKSLKGSTIFDLTTDQQLIDSIIGVEGFNKEQYMDFVSEIVVIMDLLNLAEETNNTELEAQIRQEFADEIASFFNE